MRRGLVPKRQLMPHDRHGLADLTLDVAQECTLLVIAECDRRSRRPGASRAPDAVNIGFGHMRQVVIDDMADAVDIDPARRDVGRNQRCDLARLEPGERALALNLRLVAVDCRCGDAGGVETPHHLVGAMLGAREDQRSRHAAASEEIGQQSELG